MRTSEIWQKLNALKEVAESADLKARVKYAIDEIFLGRPEAGEKLIKEIESRGADVFISKFIASVEGKKFLKTLRESRTDRTLLLKALYSYGTHLCIEHEMTKKDVSTYLLKINEEIAQVLAGKELSESFIKVFI
jgi:hypothetical protein